MWCQYPGWTVDCEYLCVAQSIFRFDRDQAPSAGSTQFFLKYRIEPGQSDFFPRKIGLSRLIVFNILEKIRFTPLAGWI